MSDISWMVEMKKRMICLVIFLCLSSVVFSLLPHEQVMGKEKVPMGATLANQILSKVLHPGWTEKQKIRAVYQYVHSEISYSDETMGTKKWRKAAVRVIRKKRGDCYGFYAISRLLLTQAHIQNKKIVYKNAAGRKHFANLVFCQGKWERFDVLSSSNPMWD